MTRLAKAPDAEYALRTKRRRRIGSDLGVAAAGLGMAALGAKGAAKAIPALRPSAIKLVPKLNRATGGAVAIGGATGATAAVNNSLLTNAELDRTEGPRHKAYTVKRQMKKTAVVKKDITANREKRNKAVPAAFAIGAGAAGAASAPLLGSHFQHKRLIHRANSLNARATAAGRSYPARAGSPAVKAVPATAGIAAVAPTASHPIGYPSIPGSLAVAGSPAVKARAGKAGHPMQAAFLKEASRTSRATAGKYKLLARPRAGKALALAAGASAAISLASRRNNKTGASRTRQDWYQG